MITRRPWLQHLAAMVMPSIAFFAWTYYQNSYLLSHNRNAYLSYYARRWQAGVSLHLVWRIGYSTLLYVAAIIALYELVLLALKGRFKGEE